MPSTATAKKAEVRRPIMDLYLAPAYAAVGLTDLAVEKMREARSMDAAEMRHELAASAEKAVKQVQQVPAMLWDQGRMMVDRAQADYEVLAERGEQVIDRILDQQATKDLMAQFDNTVSMTKGAMTTARNAAMDTERAAMRTVKTGVDEAEHVAAKLAETAREDIRLASGTVRRATNRTRASANRTADTAKRNAKTTQSRAKASGTSARKTARQASTAARAAAKKVGD